MGWLRILFYVVARMITALLAGLGLAWDYTGESALTVSSSNWGLIGLIAFVVFVLLTAVREVDLYLQPHPKVQFDAPSPAATPMTALINGTTRQVIGQGYFVRLAFKNNAKHPSGNSSTAQAMTAHISVFDNKGIMIDDWEGRWATLDEPKSYGEIWKSNKFDLQANNQQAILDIGFRLQGHLEFQGWDNFHYLSIGQSRQRLGAGSYKVRVRLAPSNHPAKDFWFKLTVPSEFQSDDLNQVKIELIKKPVIHKEGSQT